jgi:outer membrane protein insertion porin family
VTGGKPALLTLRAHPIARLLAASALFFCLLGPSASRAAPPAHSPDEAAAFTGQKIISIDVQGLKRIEKDAVLAKLTAKVGQPLAKDNVHSDIQALFGMGYFDDIEVRGEEKDGGVALVYAVRERPVISQIEFEGNERISTSDLKDVIKVKEWSILDINKVKEDTGLIQKHYEEKGFYLAKVTFEIKPLKQDEVELIYKISDYDKVQIKKITFLNNKRFTDEQLKSVFQETKEGNLLSFITSSGNFKESAFKQDLQRLQYWYLDHGYVKFRYESPVVTVSDDKRWLYISVYVDEGEQYNMGTIDFGGDLLFPKEDLAAELKLTTGLTFSISVRNADIQRLTEKYQDLGYAFTNVIPKMQIHDDSKSVDIEYDFEKGNLVYFGEINILGNTKTHDKVIRRELKIHEGELYSGTNLRKSRENVERLGYFQPGEVIFNTVTPKGKPDILNVEISIKERSTGTITLGAGYGSIQGLFFTTTISEINFLGRGQTISLSAQYAADSLSQSFNLGFTDPYAFDSRWSLGGDLYSVNFPIPNKYITHKIGFDIRAGYPIADYIYGYITYKNEGMQINNENPDLAPFEDLLVDPDRGVLSSIIWSVVRDKRNNRFETTDGNYQSISLETAGIGGDKRFIKTIGNNRFYKRLFNSDLVFRTSAEVGNMWALSDRNLPPSEKFYLGGPNNMKGYQLFLLGPAIYGNSQTPIPTGGTFEAFSLFEIEYPLIKDAGLKWVFFYDIGNTWDRIPTLDYFVLRQDAGFGIRWFSPIGPLRFEWGFPLGQKPNEISPVFSFFIGPPF